MNLPILLGLAQNAALLLVIAAIYDLTPLRWRTAKDPLRQGLFGLLLGVVGMILMLTPWVLVPGIIFDTRSILLAIIGLFLGFVPTLVAMLVTAVFRIYIGGPATVMGLCVILTTGLMGIAWHHLRKRPLEDITWRELYLFGVLIHVVMLACAFTLPMGTARLVLAQITLPVLLIYPLATALLGALMANRLRREHTVDELAKSEEQLRLAATSSNIGFFESDLVTGRVHFSAEWKKQIGYGEDEIGNDSQEWESRLHPEDRQAVLTQINAFIEGQQPDYEAEYRLRHKDGSYRWILARGALQHNPAGRAVRLLGCHIDLTRQKQDEGLYRVLTENIQDVVWILDTETMRYRYISPSAERLCGFTPAEILVRPLDSAWTPEGRQTLLGPIPGRAEAFRSGQELPERFYIEEVEQLCKNGGRAWTEVVTSYYLNPESGHVEVHGVTRDIRARRRAEVALRESEEKFRYVFDHSPVGKSITMLSGELNVNQALAEMLGYTREELEHYTWKDITSPADIELTQKGVNQLLSGEKESVRFEKRFLHKSGRLVWADLSSSLRRDPDGKPLYLMSAVVDITERKRVEDEIACQLQFETLLADLSTRFVNVPAQQLDQEIKDAQRRVCECLDLDMSTLWQWNDPNQATFTLTHSYRSIDGPPAPEQINTREYFPWSHQQLMAGKAQIISSLAELPAEAARDRETLAHFEVKTFLTFPLSTRGAQPIGALSFNAIREERTWPAEIVNRLQMIAQLFTNALSWQRSDLALRESETRFRVLSDDALAGIFILQDGRLSYVNSALAAIFGYEPQELIGADPHLVIHPDDHAMVSEYIRSRINGEEQTAHYTFLGRCKNGDTRFIEVLGARVSLGGRPAIIGNILDITARKQIEETLRKSEENYRLLFEEAADGIFIADRQGNYIDVNSSGCALLGYTRQEILQLNLRDLVAVETLKTSPLRMREIRDGHSVYNERSMRRKDGSLVEVEINGSQLPDGRLLSLVRDISSRKRAEEKVQAAQDELQRLLVEADQTRQALLDLVEDQKNAAKVLKENQAFLNEMGRTGKIGGWQLDAETLKQVWTEEVYRIHEVGSGFAPTLGSGISFYAPASKPIIERAIQRAIDFGEPFDLELEFITATGNHRWVHTIGKVQQEQGRTKTVSGTFQDITERKQAEDQIRRLNAELEQRVRERTAQLESANKELEAFAYSVSHDLRAPLRAMDGFSAALLNDYPDQIDEQGRHYLERIQEASRRMGQLINDLLSLSQVTRSGFHPQAVDLSALAQEIAANLSAQDPQRRVEFDIAPGLIAQGDPHLLKIALENLLNNAYKFSGKKEQAYIQVGMMEPAGSSGLAGEPGLGEPLQGVYFVRDNGAGFNMEYADKLFVPFQRLHGMLEFPGTGIGLVTVQRIIHRHGGQVWPEAVPDQGATFYFTLGVGG